MQHIPVAELCLSALTTWIHIITVAALSEANANKKAGAGND